MPISFRCTASRPCAVTHLGEYFTDKMSAKFPWLRPGEKKTCRARGGGLYSDRELYIFHMKNFLENVRGLSVGVSHRRSQDFF